MGPSSSRARARLSGPFVSNVRIYRSDAIAAGYCKEPSIAVDLRANVFGVGPGTGHCRVPVWHHRFIPDGQLPALDELDAWLSRIVGETKGAAPFAPKLIVHKSNTWLMDDAALVAKHSAPMVIASVGSPAPIMETIHEYGGLVFADIASMRHAEKAIATGVDGLILLTSGVGGHTGWANPSAFVRAVRSIFDGPVVLAGGVSDGVALKAAVTLGCDLAYMGTRFIATRESMAVQGH